MNICGKDIQHYIYNTKHYVNSEVQLRKHHDLIWGFNTRFIFLAEASFSIKVTFAKDKD